MIKLKKNFFIDLTVASIILLYFFYTSSGFENKFLINLARCLGIVLYIFLLIKIKVNYKIYFIQFLFLVCSIFNFLISNNINMNIILDFNIIMYGLAIYFIYHNRNNYFWRFFSILSIFLFGLYSIYNIGEYHIFPGTSRNYVSVYLIFFLFLYIISSNREYDNNITLISFYIFIVSSLSVGRGGIISTFILFFSIFVLNVLIKKKIKLLVLFSIPLLYFYFNYQLLSNLLFSRLFIQDNSIINSNAERMTMIIDYYNYSFSNLKYFIFGVPNNIILYKNLHNSYFQMHYYMGIFPIIATIFLVFLSCIKLLKNKQFYSFVMLLVFLIRSATDHLFPGHLTSIIIIYYTIYYYNYNFIK